jgi:phenylpyruvate tautomerase
MPYLKLQTNRPVSPEEQQALLPQLSRAAAEVLGKPESYVMIALESEKPMYFAGNDQPCAYVELKSLGLPEGKTAEFSAGLCSLIEETLGIGSQRIYIEFANPERHMWGWKGGTF